MQVNWKPDSHDGSGWSLYVDNKYKGLVAGYHSAAYPNGSCYYACYHHDNINDRLFNFNCLSMREAAIKLMNHHGIGPLESL